ncbi:MAG: hypothetical protein ACFE0J_04290 [Elainellaceae cyanobacterium]
MLFCSTSHLYSSNYLQTALSVGLISVSLVIGGCSSRQTGVPSPDDSASEAANTSESAPFTSSPEATQVNEIDTPVPTEFLISAEGIGDAKLGMTFGTLKQTLGSEVEFTEETSLMSDFDAIAVRKDDAVQYYILHLAGDPFTEEDVIQGLMTDNSSFMTAEEVGAGTPIKDAEESYGKATLSYHTRNESREYVRFENHPANNVSFQAGNGEQDPTGIYSAPSSEYNETPDFADSASIQSVLVVCLVEDCAG